MSEEITKDEFESYEAIRQSGVTNMFDVRTVEALSGLERKKIIDIMKSYSELVQKYPEARK